jgi:hypothetical protein
MRKGKMVNRRKKVHFKGVTKMRDGKCSSLVKDQNIKIKK